MPLTAEELRAHVDALAKFREAYEAYLKESDAEQRQAVLRAIPAAQEALNLAGGGLVVVDPPILGPARMKYQGLANTAFLHEHPGFRLTSMDESPIYMAVLDDVERTIAALELQASKAAATESHVFCRRGHDLGVRGATPDFCSKCGAPKVEKCANCQHPLDEASSRPPSFCQACGAAFPWVDRQGRIYRLENMLAEESLDEASELLVREQLEALANPDLSEDEQRERWSRVKRAAPGLWQRGQNVIEGLAVAAIRQQLGL